MKAIYFYGILLILLFTNILTPFNGDVMVSFASAFQSDFFGDFPYNVYQSWNLRGIGYKYFIYILYKITTIFVSYNNLFSFQIISKLFYYTFFITLSYCFFKLLKFIIYPYIEYKLAWQLFLIGTLAISNFICFQPEEISIYILLGMVSFSLSKYKILNYLAGIFVFFLLSIKAVTIILVAYSAIIMLYLYNSEKIKFYRYIISCTIFSIITILIYFYIIPQEINDIKDATLFQSSFLFSIQSIKLLFFEIILSIFHIPFFIIGYIGMLYLIFVTRKTKLTIWLLILFIIPFLCIVIQNKFFPYHFLLLLPFAYIIMIILYAISNNKEKILKICLLPVIICWIMNVLVPQFDFKIMKKSPYLYFHYKTVNVFYYTQKVYKPKKEVYDFINNKFQLNSEREMLFLSDGVINYFIKTKSYLRYFYPLPLQRTKYNKNIYTSKIYRLILNKTLQYKGNYIYVNNCWFNIKEHSVLNKMIETNYRIVYNNIVKGTHHVVYKRK